MKKLIALLMAIVLGLSLVACGEKEAPPEKAAAVDQKIETVDVYVISAVKDPSSDDTYELLYDENFRIRSIKTESEDTGVWEKQLVFDDAGRILSACFRDEGEKIQCTYTLYNYDPYGNQVRENAIYIYDEAGKILFVDDVAYIYDEAGRLIKEEGPDSAKEYTYDEAGRLVRWQDSDDWYCAYTYDEKGCLTAMVSGYHEEIHWDNSYEYDENGILLKVTAKYSAVESDIIRQFEYKKVKVTREQVAAMEAERAYIWDNITTIFW